MKFPIRKDHYDRVNGSEEYIFGVEAVLEYAENLPAVDSVEVVYCYECKYFEADTGFCNYHDHGMHVDDFCSRGRKRE